MAPCQSGGLAVLLLNFLRFSFDQGLRLAGKKVIFTLLFYSTDVLNCLLTVVSQPVHSHHQMLQ